MRSFAVKTTLSLTFLSLTLFTFTATKAADKAPEKDPYGGVFLLPAGPSEGKPLETAEKRSIQILDEKEAAAYSPAAGEMVAANFFSEGKFWIAIIPENAVEDVIFHKEDFSAIVPAAHSQMRFKLKPGKTVRLKPQVGTVLPKKAEISDVIFSAQAVTIKGETYDLIKGKMGHFGLALRVMSLEDRYFEMITLQGHKVTQVRLKLSDEEKQKVFAYSLQRSDEAGMTRMYDTLNASCTTEVFEILDHCVTRGKIAEKAHAVKRSPLWPDTYLWWRGLYYHRWENGDSHMQTLNEELTALETDADLLQRKAAYEAALTPQKNPEELSQ